MSNKNPGFNQGYFCACAVLMQSHGDSTQVYDCVNANYSSIEKLREDKVAEEDIQTLMPVFEEIDRNRTRNEANC